MPKAETFIVNELEFTFENNIDGTEIIKLGDQVVSKKRSLMGGEHSFSYNGDDYIVKVKPRIFGITFDVNINGKKVVYGDPNSDKKISGTMMAACAWPLGLLFIGGAIGGLSGGVATGLNMKIYKSHLNIAIKVFLNIITGLCAIGIWLFLALIIEGSMK
jgi:hypothetical protein